jgi:hypothetical protein
MDRLGTRCDMSFAPLLYVDGALGGSIRGCGIGDCRCHLSLMVAMVALCDQNDAENQPNEQRHRDEYVPDYEGGSREAPSALPCSFDLTTSDVAQDNSDGRKQEGEDERRDRGAIGWGRWRIRAMLAWWVA